jgi:hypothetical protein
MIPSPTFFFLGLLLLLVGYLILTWASSRNLKDVAIGAALSAGWTLLWRRQRPGIPDEVTSRVDEVRAQVTHLGRARVLTGYAVKHVVAQVMGIVGTLTMLLGAVFLGLGLFWR